MAAYARRHYGIDSFRLRPRVIVQHFTAGDSFQSAFNTFAPNRPDQELHELPGVCAHYVIDKSGRIYQLCSTRIMCRHTVGLNYTAIGIEHVGRSDGQVMGNSRQRRASLRLTRLLQGQYRIRTRNVIGHNENRSSPSTANAWPASATRPTATSAARRWALPPAADSAAGTGQRALTRRTI